MLCIAYLQVFNLDRLPGIKLDIAQAWSRGRHSMGIAAEGGKKLRSCVDLPQETTRIEVDDTVEQLQRRIIEEASGAIVI